MKATHVLFMHCDALHADVLRHTKWPLLKTPHLDRLASESVVFDNAFVQYPTCVPSRASFTTGFYPQQLGLFNHSYVVPDRIPSLADRLKACGYESICFGRTHGGQKGFDVIPNRKGKEAYGCSNLGFHADSDSITGTFMGPIEDHHDWAAANDFEKWLKARTDERPIFASVGFMAPHTPMYPPKEFDGTYLPESMVLPDFDPAELENKPEKQTYIWKERWGIHPEPVRRTIMAKYFDLCTYVDACIGKVLRALEAKGILEQTALFFFADHGEMLGEHGMIGKWFSLYDDAARTPLAVRLPGKLFAGERRETLVELVDLVPTALELLDESGAKELPGRSLIPSITDATKPHREYVFSMMETARMIRSHEWKLCVHTGRSSLGYSDTLFHDDEGELYDLINDPSEKRNLYHEPKHAAKRWALARRLIEHEIQIQHDLGSRGPNHH